MPGTRFTTLSVAPASVKTPTEFKLFKVSTVAWDPGSVAAGASPELAIPVTDAVVGDLFLLFPPSNLNAGLIHSTRICRTAGQVAVRIANPTAGALDAPSGTWTYIQIRS